MLIVKFRKFFVHDLSNFVKVSIRIVSLEKFQIHEYFRIPLASESTGIAATLRGIVKGGVFFKRG